MNVCNTCGDCTASATCAGGGTCNCNSLAQAYTVMAQGDTLDIDSAQIITSGNRIYYNNVDSKMPGVKNFFFFKKN